MPREISVNVTVRLTVRADDNAEILNTLNEMDYDFKSNTDDARIVDTEIIGHEVTNSKYLI